MFNDSYDKGIVSEDSISMNLSDSDSMIMTDEKKHWKVIDKIIYADGREEIREYYNTVVDDCSKLIACLMKAQSGYSGITYWAVGSGASSWDNANPPAPAVSDAKLTTETFRKAVTSSNIKFLDASNAETSTVTNKLQIKVTFSETEANGELREFALFGGNATATANSGLMINRKTHGLIYKTSGMRLERTIRLIF